MADKQSEKRHLIQDPKDYVMDSIRRLATMSVFPSKKFKLELWDKISPTASDDEISEFKTLEIQKRTIRYHVVMNDVGLDEIIATMMNAQSLQVKTQGYFRSMGSPDKEKGITRDQACDKIIQRIAKESKDKPYQVSLRQVLDEKPQRGGDPMKKAEKEFGKAPLEERIKFFQGKGLSREEAEKVAKALDN